MIGGSLLLRPAALRGLAAERAKLLAWTLMLVALGTQALGPSGERFWWLGGPWGLVGIAIYLSLILVPALMWAGDLWSGDGSTYKLGRKDYDQHLCVLFVLWSLCLLLARIASVQLAWAPLVLFLLYTAVALRELDYLTWPAAVAATLSALVTVPVVFLLPMVFSFAPFFILIPVFFLGWQYIRDFFSERRRESSFRDHLRALTVNPKDSDAHYQIGLIHLDQYRYTEAAEAFARAIEIHPDDPDYHYSLGVTLLQLNRPREAFDAFEKVYYRNPDYGFGDIRREIGRTYLELDYPDEAEKFLREFLEKREPDAEGRYWLARVYQKTGDLDQAREQLRILLDRQRTFNTFRIKETRRWRREGHKLQKAVGSGQ